MTRPQVANQAGQLSKLPAAAVRTLFGLRSTALTAAEPIDYLARLLNGKRGFPPLRLRRYAGPLSSIEASAGEFCAYLKLLCGANSESRILDVGCGFGLLALALEPYLAGAGRYVGLDINRSAIEWANRRFSKTSRFEFRHVDIHNGMYNPRGKVRGDTVDLKLASGGFDIVILKSVFTHLRPAEVRNYLRQVARTLDANGACLATFFLLNDEQRAYDQKGLNSVNFAFGDDEWRYAIREVPEIAVAYSQDVVAKMTDEVGLCIRRIHPGNWSGQPNGLSYQDVVILGLAT